MLLPMQPWSVADIIDLEAQLAWDRVQAHHQGGGSAGLDQRDRDIGDSCPEPDDGDAQLRHFVHSMRERSDHLPGQRVLAAWAGVRALACLIASGLGIGLAVAVLRYDGSRPISILASTGLLVLLPVATLLLTLLLQLPGLRRLFVLTGGPLQWLLGHAMLPWLRKALPPGPPGYHAALGNNLLRRQHGQFVYGSLWRTCIGEFVQHMGLLVMTAALVTVLLKVVFTDLAFSWGSTLQVDEAWMRSWVDAIALPWAWLWSSGLPSDELIAQSRYSQLEDSFAGATPGTRSTDAMLLGQWWGFLVASMLSWAVLPRLVAAVIFGRRRQTLVAAQARRSATLSDHQDQVQRLRDQGPRFRSGPGSSVPSTPTTEAIDDDWPNAAPALAIVWDDCLPVAIVPAWLAERGGPVQEAVRAGHGSDAKVDAEAIRSISSQEPGPVVLLVAGDEQPLAEVLAFLRDIHHAAGQRPIVIILLAAKEDNLARWQQAAKSWSRQVVSWELPA